MLKYILKRILHMIPILLITTIVLFGFLQLMPGDPVMAYLGESAGKIKPEVIQAAREKLGLDKPIYVQYWYWLQRTLAGDLGESVQYKKPVVDLMGGFIWNSFILNIGAFFLALIICIPVGIRSAVKRYGLWDNFWTVFSLLGLAMPSFFFAILLIYAFAIIIPIFPMSGMVTAGKSYVSGWDYWSDVLQHLILPLILITIISMASLTRYVRNSMIEIINQDYIRTARAKGLNEKVVIYKHAFRNALIPIVTYVGLMLPGLFAGSILIETTFQWPGIGRVLYESLINRDYSVSMASNLFFTFLMLLGNLLADLGYAFVDPRVKVE